MSEDVGDGRSRPLRTLTFGSPTVVAKFLEAVRGAVRARGLADSTARSAERRIVVTVNIETEFRRPLRFSSYRDLRDVCKNQEGFLAGRSGEFWPDIRGLSNQIPSQGPDDLHYKNKDDWK